MQDIDGLLILMYDNSVLHSLGKVGREIRFKLKAPGLILFGKRVS
jgi:hypothetical protein